MNKSIILQIVVDTPLYQYFDYLPPPNYSIDQFKIGIRVWVPFRKQRKVGILIAINNQSDLPLSKLRQVEMIIDEEPIFDPSLLQLLLWAANYYHYPLGETVLTTLPKSLQQGKPLLIEDIQQLAEISEKKPDFCHLLNEEQQKAVNNITSNLHHYSSFLLYGVTGSGKTEVYLHCIQAVLQQNKQALVLVPEIGLTPQTVLRFKKHFSQPIAVLHSGCSQKEKYQVWLRAKQGKIAIIIGTRSAVFTPFLSLGIIIIDESHDTSFKQQDGFRYSARDVSIMRARLNHIPVVLGSATPNFESIINAKRGRSHLLYLKTRTGKATLPHFTLIDMRNKKLINGFSLPVIEKIKYHLENNNQVLLFLNRRGFAPTLLCASCGWIAKCKHCDAKLTFHQQSSYLHCHHCDNKNSLPKHCPQCQSPELLPLGQGTERIEKNLESLFPDTEILRIDRDTTRRKGTLNTLLKKVSTGKNQLLIGTQMLAKGHHFPNVTLVVLLNIDNGFFSSDFRATERMAQLILQVSGRAGREDKPGEVILQTYQPHNPLLTQLLKYGYEQFVELSLQERQMSFLPPYSHMAILRSESLIQPLAIEFLQQLSPYLHSLSLPELQVLGPIPSPMEKCRGYFRAQLLIQSSQRKCLHKALSALINQIKTIKVDKKVRWSLDVDPAEMF